MYQIIVHYCFQNEGAFNGLTSEATPFMRICSLLASTPAWISSSLSVLERCQICFASSILTWKSLMLFTCRFYLEVQRMPVRQWNTLVQLLVYLTVTQNHMLEPRVGSLKELEEEEIAEASKFKFVDLSCWSFICWLKTIKLFISSILLDFWGTVYQLCVLLHCGIRTSFNLYNFYSVSVFYILPCLDSVIMSDFLGDYIFENTLVVWFVRYFHFHLAGEVIGFGLVLCW